MKESKKFVGGYQAPPTRVLGRTDWSGFEFTPAMIEAARKNADAKDYLWLALKESGYLSAAIAAGGGVIA